MSTSDGDEEEEELDGDAAAGDVFDDVDVEPEDDPLVRKAAAFGAQTLRGAHAAARARRVQERTIAVEDSEDEDGGDGDFSDGDGDGDDSEGGGGAWSRKRDSDRWENAGAQELEREIEDTLAQCDRLSADLRAALGVADSAPPPPPAQGSGDGFEGVAGEDTTARFNATEASAALKLLSAEQVAAASTPEVVDGDAPAIPPLKGYQVVGVNFLMLLHSRDMGAILADDMGLGKTAQAISFLACVNAAAREAGQTVLPHLVIAPTSVLENWARELSVWAPCLRVRLFHGAARAAIRDEVFDQKRADDDALPFDVLLCCYTLFERDSAEQLSDRSWLRKLRFGYAVLDEAHAVKNRSSQRAERLRTVLSKAAPRRLMLTGTPLQNDLNELLALLELLMPRLFAGKSKLLTAFEAQQGSAGGEGTREGGRAFGVSQDNISRVRAMLAPFVLRRLKTEVLSQLTPKTQHLERLDMLPNQKALYSAAVASVRQEIASKAATKQPRGGSRQPSSTDLTSTANEQQEAPVLSAGQLERSMGASRLRALFTYLRKVANHPLLVRHLYSQASVDEIVKVTYAKKVFGPSAPLKKVQQHVASLSDFALHSLCCDDKVRAALAHLRLPDEAVLSAGKAKWLADILPKLKASGRRVLIFSQWKIQLDVLEWLLHRLDLRFFRLDGSTPVEERQQLVDEYNAPDSPIFAFLLSTRAGGQGINLVGADTVILHDCDFNPQIDRQAEDRAHRLGQTKPVSIYRLVTSDSVDSRIVDIATAKLSLDAAVLCSQTAPAMTDKEIKSQEQKSMAEILSGLLCATSTDLSSGNPPAADGEAPLIIGDLADD